MYFRTTISILLLQLTCFGQGENNWWYFGSVAVSFNGAIPTVHFDSAMDQNEGSSSISGPDGDLLFYTDGVTVWNRNNVPMPNGEGLLGHSSSSQSALIVPQPSHCGIYYLFTVPSSVIGPMAYSIVDMSLDGGLGDITVKNIPLQTDVTERLSATLHANGVDYWVAGQYCSDLSIFSYLLTAQGLDLTPIVSSPPAPTNGGCHYGYMKFSPDGQKLCTSFLYARHAYLFDFDNATGIASNSIQWSPFFGSQPQYDTGGYGVEFSPNSSLLYLHSSNAPRVLLQYDLSSSDEEIILASRFVVDSMLTDDYGYAYGGALQMAPDGRLYVCRLNETTLSALNTPDGIGASCGFIEHALDISPETCNGGLPNHLWHYPSCTDQVGMTEFNDLSFDLFPNPTSDHVEICFPSEEARSGTIRVIDIRGRVVLHALVTSDRITLSLEGFASGVYTVSVAKEHSLRQQRLVVHR